MCVCILYLNEPSPLCFYILFVLFFFSGGDSGSADHHRLFQTVCQLKMFDREVKAVVRSAGVF